MTVAQFIRDAVGVGRVRTWGLRPGDEILGRPEDCPIRVTTVVGYHVEAVEECEVPSYRLVVVRGSRFAVAADAEWLVGRPGVVSPERRAS